MTPSPEDARAAAQLATDVAALLDWPAAQVEVGPLQLNDFSACFWMDHRDASDGVYVKLPKLRLLTDRQQRIFPLDERDRAAARGEFESLTYLDRVLAGAPVRFARPRGFVEDAAAVIVHRIRGGDAFGAFREWDRRGRRGDASARGTLLGWMERLGESLAAFHAPDASPSALDVGEIVGKVARYRERLAERGAAPRALRAVAAAIAALDRSPVPTRATRVLKGIDIRNLLWTDDRRDLVFLDPGVMKRGVQEADISRFLMTVRILYWGAPSFVLGERPMPEAETAFLRGYGVRVSARALEWQFLKETFKHWWMAYVTIAEKSWPGPAKRLMERVYVDPFYTRLMNETLGRLRII